MQATEDQIQNYLEKVESILRSEVSPAMRLRRIGSLTAAICFYPDEIEGPRA